jgi:lipoprotein-anchoring transpeptidase ErfK/SrfK
MYFFGSYAIHGVYWHNNFGAPASRGCVGLEPAQAEWLFGWASEGTRVVVQQ